MLSWRLSKLLQLCPATLPTSHRFGGKTVNKVQVEKVEHKESRCSIKCVKFQIGQTPFTKKYMYREKKTRLVERCAFCVTYNAVDVISHRFKQTLEV